jgi:hypothetical protein
MWNASLFLLYNFHDFSFSFAFCEGNLTRVTRVLGPGSTYERWRLPRWVVVCSCSNWPWRIYLGRKKLVLTLLCYLNSHVHPRSIARLEIVSRYGPHWFIYLPKGLG